MLWGMDKDLQLGCGQRGIMEMVGNSLGKQVLSRISNELCVACDLTGNYQSRQAILCGNMYENR